MITSTLLSSFLVSASVTLAWDATTDTTVTGYKIYTGNVSKTYTKSVDVGKTTKYQVTGLGSGATYYFAATAYNAQGLESDFSTEVTAAIPSIPSNLKIAAGTLTASVTPGDSYNLLASSDLVNWQTVKSFVAGSSTDTTFYSMNRPQEFFRMMGTAPINPLGDQIRPPMAPTLVKVQPMKNFWHYRPGHHPVTEKGAERLARR